MDNGERYADMLGKFLEDISRPADRKVSLGNDSSAAGRTAKLEIVETRPAIELTDEERRRITAQFLELAEKSK